MIHQLKGNLDQYIKFEFSSYLSHAWGIYKKNTGSIIGFTLLSWVMIFVSFFVIGIIPIVGIIVLLILGYPAILCLYNGFFIVARKTINNEPVDFGDFFGGFKTFGKILGLFYILLVFMIPVILLNFYLMDYSSVFMEMINNGGQTDPESILAWSQEMQSGIWTSQLVSLLIHGIMGSIMFFAAPIAVDTELSAMESLSLGFKTFIRKPLPLIVTNILWLIVVYISILPCFLGLFVTIPLTYFLMFTAYHSILAPHKVSTLETKIDSFGSIEIDRNSELDDDELI